MALDIYINTDLERGLTATLIMAMATYAANGAANTEHASGILDHAQAQAALYGLSWPAILRGCKMSLGAGARELLDAALAGAALEGGQWATR